MKTSRKEILKALTQFYQAGLATPEAFMLDHLSNDLTRFSYIDKGQDMLAQLSDQPKVLDWGTGFGQVAFVLAKLGAEVTAYDVVKREHSLLDEVGLELEFGSDEVKLPFVDNQFDAVVSCGVLEHVPNILGSLQEVRRVLKPGGKLFIYNLPYIFSPSEAYAAYRKISVHPIKFTKLGTAQLLELAGLQPVAIGHENGIPKRLTGPLQRLRAWGDQLTSLLLFLDKLIVRLPLVKSVMSNSIKAVAIKTDSISPDRAQLTRLWWD